MTMPFDIRAGGGRTLAGNLGRWPARRWLKSARAAIVAAREAEPAEFEQMLIRYALGLATTFCVIICIRNQAVTPAQAEFLSVFVPAAWLGAFGFFVHLILWPARHLARRTASIIFDASAMSMFLHFGGGTAAIFFPIYLWVILGNGFRFGVSYMFGAMAANAGSFAVMAVLTPYWRSEWAFAVGVFVALIAIPLYAVKLIRNLREATERAEAASQAKTEFLGNMSHELRTPLNAIMGLSQVLDRTAATPEDRMSAMSIHTAAGRLLEMVDSILSFQKIETRQVTRHHDPFDIKRLLLEMRSIMLPLAQRKGLHLHIRFATPLPDWFLADQHHVKTVLLNLAGNAVKYTNNGHVCVTASYRGTGADGRLCIEVRDTGIGIEPEAHARIFERFAQAAERSAEGGVGLGLSMCKSLVGLLGGEIDFVSTPGQGSTFWFEFPAPVCSGESCCPPNEIACRSIAALMEETDFEQLSAGVAAALPGKKRCGAYIADPMTFVRDNVASGELWKYVLIIDENRLDTPSQKAIWHAALDAPVPPAVVLIGGKPGEGALGRMATAFVPRGAWEEGRDLIRTVAKWHGTAVRPLLPGEHEAQTDRGAPALPISPKRVLVADDNAFNRQVARRLLALDDHKTALAVSGEQALDLLLAGGFDIAFLDINMPDENGIEITKLYHAAVEQKAQIPLLAMTADVSEAMREACLQAGMAGVVHKPVELDALRQAIAAHAASMPHQDATAAAVAALSATKDIMQGLDSPQDEGVPKEPPAFDRPRLDEMLTLFGLSAFRDEMLNMFAQDFEANLDELGTAIRADDRRATRDKIHALKSAANNIGALRIARLCANEDAAAAQADMTMYEAIRSEYRRFMDEIGAYVDERALAAAYPARARRRALKAAVPA